MDRTIVPASITLEKSLRNRKYNWKSNPKKESIYNILEKRAFIRFSCKNFADKLNKLPREKRQVFVEFIDDFKIRIKRIKTKGISLQGYGGLHSYVQFIVNSALPKNLWRKFDTIKNTSKTYPINIELNFQEWKDLKISPEDFLIEVEKDAKTLMRTALKKGFKIERVSKGREYDISLIGPNEKEFFIAISSHAAKTENRSREQRIRKILLDISKMLTKTWKNKKVIPIIISQPIKSDSSWSYTTHNYFNFYKEEFGFKFITTEFKKGWEDNVIKELLKIENVQTTRN